uniref:Uncharacterized protein n=1 Tax=viral metagenome TaxID=1070528 RepID=A0A6M3KA34_9ZZZZ
MTPEEIFKVINIPKRIDNHQLTPKVWETASTEERQLCKDLSKAMEK